MKKCVDCGTEKRSNKGDRCGSCAAARRATNIWIGATERRERAAETMSENMKRLWRERRSVMVSIAAMGGRRCGEKGSLRRLTDAQVLEIRASEEPTAALATKYGVSIRTLRDARNGRDAYTDIKMKKENT